MCRFPSISCQASDPAAKRRSLRASPPPGNGEHRWPTPTIHPTPPTCHLMNTLPRSPPSSRRGCCACVVRPLFYPSKLLWNLASIALMSLPSHALMDTTVNTAKSRERRITMNQNVHAQVAALRKMTPSELREKYLEVFGEASFKPVSSTMLAFSLRRASRFRLAYILL